MLPLPYIQNNLVDMRNDTEGKKPSPVQISELAQSKDVVVVVVLVVVVVVVDFTLLVLPVHNVIHEASEEHRPVWKSKTSPDEHGK